MKLALFLFEFCVAIAATAVATLVALELAALHIEAPYLLLLIGIVTAAIIGGRASGVIAVVLSLVLVWFFFIPPVWSFALPSWRYVVTLALFLVAAGGICWLFHHERNRIDELSDANASLRDQMRRKRPI